MNLMGDTTLLEDITPVGDTSPLGDITLNNNKLKNNENSNIKEKTNVEFWVKLKMTFVGVGKPVSHVMMLKSSATILRALKKFTTVINVRYRKLRFCWKGVELTRTELA